MKKHTLAAIALSLLASVTSQAYASVLTLSFDTNFGDLSDPDTAAPTCSTCLTAVFDDEGTAGSVQLTMTVASGIGIATVEEVYFNVKDDIDINSLSITPAGGTGPAANNIYIGTGMGGSDIRADSSGVYDILFDLPPPGSDTFGDSDTLIFDITGTNLEAFDFAAFSVWTDPTDVNGPFVAAAKFASTGTGLLDCPGDPEAGKPGGAGECSDWLGVTADGVSPPAAIPVPAAVWLFGSGLLGLVGVARRRKS